MDLIETDNDRALMDIADSLFTINTGFARPRGEDIRVCPKDSLPLLVSPGQRVISVANEEQRALGEVLSAEYKRAGLGEFTIIYY